MAKALHFDCFSGASGDMILGALLDLGAPLDGLRAALGSLAIDYGEIAAERVLRSGISATKFRLRERREGAAPRQEHAHADLEPGHVHAHGHEHGHQHTHGHDHRHGHDGHHAHDHHHGHDHRHDHGHDHQHGHHHHGAGAHAHDHGGHAHHSLTEIAGFIRRSALSADGKARAVRLFERLAEAEAAIHDMPVDQVHLHEVGALDSIVDIVGAVYALEWFGAEEITSSPLNVGSGTVRCAHGVLPVPAPATARLLRGVPIYAGAVQAELVTPTGALLLTDYARTFGPLPAMRVEGAGYGAGDRDFPGHPNVLRVFLGETTGGAAPDRVVVVECEIDDMNPQLFGPLMDRLFAAGALDVFYAPVMMKKTRPGVLVTVLAAPAGRQAVADVLFAETTTIGVRYQEMQRDTLAREIRTLETPLGPVRFKLASRGAQILNAAPEFDDLARIARERGVPLKDVQALAQKAWLDAAR